MKAVMPRGFGRGIAPRVCKAILALNPCLEDLLDPDLGSVWVTQRSIHVDLLRLGADALIARPSGGIDHPHIRWRPSLGAGKRIIGSSRSLARPIAPCSADKLKIVLLHRLKHTIRAIPLQYPPALCRGIVLHENDLHGVQKITARHHAKLYGGIRGGGSRVPEFPPLHGYWHRGSLIKALPNNNMKGRDAGRLRLGDASSWLLLLCR